MTENALRAFRVDLLDRVPPARLLLLLAGASALVLGVLMFVLQLVSGPRIGPLGTFGTSAVWMMLIINLVFGALLLYGYLGMEHRESDWALLALAFSLVLLILGGIAGAVAGILGLVASGSVFVRAWRAPA